MSDNITRYDNITHRCLVCGSPDHWFRHCDDCGCLACTLDDDGGEEAIP